MRGDVKKKRKKERVCLFERKKRIYSKNKHQKKQQNEKKQKQKKTKNKKKMKERKKRKKSVGWNTIWKDMKVQQEMNVHEKALKVER